MVLPDWWHSDASKCRSQRRVYGRFVAISAFQFPMSVFEFAKSALSNALGPKGPGLPFTVGDFVSDVDYMWKLHDGVKKVAILTEILRVF